MLLQTNKEGVPLFSKDPNFLRTLGAMKGLMASPT
jgi:hypothetical protein